MNNLTTVINIKGYEKQDYIYIGRPSRWGNPFLIGRDGTREEVIEKYREYIQSMEHNLHEELARLKGKKLGCWCHPEPCHGDVLVKIIENFKRCPLCKQNYLDTNPNHHHCRCGGLYCSPRHGGCGCCEGFC
jgi:hypothetical protein